MAGKIGPNIVTDGLVLHLDAANIKSFRGEPTVNLSKTLADAWGGNVSLSYTSNVYICTADEINVVDMTAPNAQYSRFHGNTDSINNQVFTTTIKNTTEIINIRNKTITYSVYLKGSGTCHLSIYDDATAYGTSPTITLTNTWTRYAYTKTIGNYTSSCWCAVRGILTTTDVYVAAQQSEEKSYATPFVNGTRGTTVATGGGWIDLSGNANSGALSDTGITFNNNCGSILFDNIDDYISFPNNIGYISIVSVFSWFKCNGSPKGNYHIIFGGSQLEISIPGATGKLRIGVLTNNTRYVTEHGSGLTDGNWHNAGFTFDGSTKIGYIDGLDVGSQSGITGSLSYNFSNRYMGRFGSDATYALNGNIAYASIYNRVLTPDEILQNYRVLKSRFTN